MRMSRLPGTLPGELTLVSSITGGRHRENYIDESSGLGDLPVYTGCRSGGGHPGDVDIEVSNRFEEILNQVRCEQMDIDE